MKRLLLIAGVLGVLVSVSSCKKEYTCECKVNSYTNGSVSGVNTQTFPIKSTKAEARRVCRLLESDSMPSPSNPFAFFQCKLTN